MIKGPRSYIKYPEMPDPPQLKYQSISRMAVHDGTKKLLDLAQIKAQKIIVQEDKYKTMADNFSKARSLIKASNNRYINDRIKESIYGSTKFAKTVQNERFPSHLSLRSD